MKIFFLLIEVTPAPNSAHFSEVGGAFVNCWIKSNTEESAAITAQASIQNDGWIIITIEETFIAEKEIYSDKPESLELFEQAEIDGEAYRFHTWPLEPQDDDTIH
jgi:hypothetical protein